jgi:hypothetical protein
MAQRLSLGEWASLYLPDEARVAPDLAPARPYVPAVYHEQIRQLADAVAVTQETEDKRDRINALALAAEIAHGLCMQIAHDCKQAIEQHNAATDRRELYGKVRALSNAHADLEPLARALAAARDGDTEDSGLGDDLTRLATVLNRVACPHPGR